MSITQKRTPEWSSVFSRSSSVPNFKARGSYGPKGPRAREHTEEHRVSQLLDLFTNILMKDGKKTKAQALLRHALAHICWKTGLPLHQIVYGLRDQMSPLFGLRSLRVGGSTVQVPFLLPQHNADAQGFRWLLQGARRRQGKFRVSRRPSLALSSPHAGAGPSGLQSFSARKGHKAVRPQQRVAGFTECLAAEIEDTLGGQGFAAAQRKERHKRALANRQYSHYARW